MDAGVLGRASPGGSSECSEGLGSVLGGMGWEATAVLQARGEESWAGAVGVAVGWAEVEAMVMG